MLTGWAYFWKMLTESGHKVENLDYAGASHTAYTREDFYEDHRINPGIVLWKLLDIETLRGWTSLSSATTS